MKKANIVYREFTEPISHEFGSVCLFPIGLETSDAYSVSYRIAEHRIELCLNVLQGEEIYKVRKEVLKRKQEFIDHFTRILRFSAKFRILIVYE